MKVFIYIVCLFLLQTPFVFAQSGGDSGDGVVTGGDSGDGVVTGGPSGGSARIDDPLDGSGINSIIGFFQAILDILLIFAVPIIVFFIIYAGFNYVTARGNAEKIKAAHNALLYALIGGVIVLGANVILDIIGNTVCDITDGGSSNFDVCSEISN